MMPLSMEFDKGLIKGQARGRWFEILPAINPKLSHAVANAGQHVPCPVSGGYDGFRFSDESGTDGHGFSNSYDNTKLADGFGIIQWSMGCTFNDAIRHVAAVLNGERVEARARPPVQPVQQPTPKNESGLQRYAWFIKKQTEAGDFLGTSGIQYLKSRGVFGACVSMMHDVRSIERGGDCQGLMPYYAGKPIRDSSGAIVYTSAMVGIARNNAGDYCGAHIVYLAPNGRKGEEYLRGISGTEIALKKPISKTMRKARLTMSGSSVRLGDIGERAFACEGLETGLAIAKARKTGSVLCAGHGSLLQGLEIPAHVSVVTIMADKDRNGAGMVAALALKERVIDSGRDAEIILPPSPIPDGKKGIDWLDDMTALENIDLTY